MRIATGRDCSVALESSLARHAIAASRAAVVMAAMERRTVSSAE